ncbi:hypothetical protein QJS10_CPB14g01343 [Acorus calamus]|uniref:Uncharacterized protein n=1 Tax=Acorus calamus TaxID=4465 RepID=A0AAV9DBI8_ACOCL|nr:hypothetical protein QJS10_CPB14g01343 [Acorus calamus]
MRGTQNMWSGMDVEASGGGHNLKSEIPIFTFNLSQHKPKWVMLVKHFKFGADICLLELVCMFGFWIELTGPVVKNAKECLGPRMQQEWRSCNAYMEMETVGKSDDAQRSGELPMCKCSTVAGGGGGGSDGDATVGGAIEAVVGKVKGSGSKRCDHAAGANRVYASFVMVRRTAGAAAITGPSHRTVGCDSHRPLDAMDP